MPLGLVEGVEQVVAGGHAQIGKQGELVGVEFFRVPGDK